MNYFEKLLGLDFVPLLFLPDEFSLSALRAECSLFDLAWLKGPVSLECGLLGPQQKVPE